MTWEADSPPSSPARSPAATLFMAGAGNIMSFFVPLAARMDGVHRLVICDRDRYEEGNWRGQDFDRSMVGRFKAEVQAERAQRINPQLAVEAVCEDLWSLPLGRFRSDLIVSGLDSVGGRLCLNQAAWRLGIPWLDGGVEPGQLLVRISGFAPGAASPCFACGLSQEELGAGLQVIHPCRLAGGEVFPTHGTAAVGAAAAAHLALQAGLFFAKGSLDSQAGHESLFVPSSGRLHHTALPRDPACRFDHAAWAIQPLPRCASAMSVGELLQRVRDELPRAAESRLRFPGRTWARHLSCPRCGHTQACFCLPHRRTMELLTCPACGEVEMSASAFDLLDSLGPGLGVEELGVALGDVGLRHGDVLAMTRPGETGETFLELDFNHAGRERSPGFIDRSSQASTIP